MRYLLAAISLLVAVSPSLVAQQSPVRVSVFMENAPGASIEFRLAPRWAVELAGTSSDTHQLTIGGIFTGHVIEFETRTFDLTTHYYFVNTSRWQPYAGAGVRRVTVSSDEVDGSTSPEVEGGVHFMITPSFSVRMDAKSRIGTDNTSYDPGLRGSIGVAWRF